MDRQWTFGQKVAAGFALAVALAIGMSAVAVYSLRSVVASKDRVIAVDAQLLVDVERLEAATERKVAAVRGYLLTKDEPHLERMRDARGAALIAVGRLKQALYTAEGRQLLDVIERLEASHQEAVDRVVALRRTDAPLEGVGRAFEDQVVPKRAELRASVVALAALEQRLLDEARQAATETASSAVTLVVAIAVAIALLAAVVALVLTRALGRQIGTAVGQVQSSSAELQAAANQQVTGAKEQATAMNEITTTISELLATSRQIAESAQRVAQIADRTASSARSGEGTVQKADDSTAGMRKQVELIVSHMLDLGKKSQQIGAVLDIVAELAEQTNILAINATIEAAGAGEAGRRFAVVADEIRKLADRVAGSTKEIRTLIEDVRGAVNTTVMTTEAGSKAVEAVTRQFSDVATSFKQIADLVGTTTEAAREIELSTKQQATAVEQVNVAIANVAQATKETEASSSQTLQTASQLATLSRELLRLVQPQAGA
jgi:methyl-accepting chemotaxis protein